MSVKMDEKQPFKKNKTTKSRRETAVQGTNDSSIVSKCSMAAQGYFEDDFLQGFVGKITRRAPLIHRGYYIRAKTIDHILKTFIAENDGPKQIISLGAGFDSAYFRLFSKGLLAETVFFEVDFPEVVKRKCALIKDSPAMMKMVGESSPDINKQSPLIELSTKTYNLLGVDLSQTNTLEAALKLCNMDLDRPTLLLSECVLTYMTRRCASAVVKWAAETFCNSTFILYEQINPNDAFGLFMQQHFHTVGSPLKSINYFPTIQSQRDRFMKLGWKSVEALDMNQFYFGLLGPSERARVEGLEPFDEYEEWHLKCAHYMVLCGYHGNCRPLLAAASWIAEQDKTDIKTFDGVISLSMPFLKTVVKRFGHSMCMVDGVAVSIGGFGEQTGKHMRVTDIGFTDPVTMETEFCDPGVDNKISEVSRMHATLSCVKDGGMILIGGRLSPMSLCTKMVAIQVKYEKVVDEKMKADIKGGENVCAAMNSFSALNCAMKDDSFSKMNSKKSDENMRFNDDSKNNNVAVDNSTETMNNSGENKVESDNDVLMNCSPYNEVLVFSNSSKKGNGEYSCQQSTCTEMEISNSECGDKYEEREVRNSEAIGGKKYSGERKRSDEARPEITANVTGVSCEILDQQGNLPCPRWRHTAVLHERDGEEHIVVYGGRTQAVQALADCYMYTLKSFTWTKIEAMGSCPLPRHSHTSSMWKNYMVIAGGLSEHLQPLDSVHLLDVDTWTWSQLDCSIRPRYSHTAHVIDNILVLVGGVSLSHLPLGVTMVHLPSGFSTEFSLPDASKSSLWLLHRHTSVMLRPGFLMILGGGGNCFSFGTHLNTSPLVLDLSRALDIMEEQLKK